MPTRRLLATCVICALAGLVAEDAQVSEVRAEDAPQPTTGVKRRILRSTDGPVPGYITILIEGEIAPGALVARHTHPGVESSYVLEGGGTLEVQGRPDAPFAPGTGFHIGPDTPHALRNGPAVTRLASTYVVEKSRPLASPAPA